MRDVNIAFDKMTEDDYKNLVTACYDADVLSLCKALYSHLKKQPIIDMYTERVPSIETETPKQIMLSINTIDDLRRIW